MAEIACKICGLTRPGDMALCHDLGVAFAGMVFAPESPRRISPAQAAALPSGAALRVGVFAGTGVAAVLAAAKEARLDLVQLHGDEDEAFCRDIGPERVIKVLWPARLGLAALNETMDRFAPVCAYFLLESGTGGGGSGKIQTWNALASLRPPRPWLLAGGLGPETVDTALAQCRPNGVDMNSALEIAPGIKDHTLVRQAVETVRRAGKKNGQKREKPF